MTDPIDHYQYVPESKVLVACIQWLHIQGCSVIRNNTTAFKNTYRRKDGSTGVSWIRTGKKGSGDIIACSPKGKWIEVECKSTNGKLRPEQQLRKIEIDRLNGIYICARSVDDLEARKADILG